MLLRFLLIEVHLHAQVRFVSCPDKMSFWKNILNIIDFVSILPFYINLPFADSNHQSKVAKCMSLHYVESKHIAGQ